MSFLLSRTVWVRVLAIAIVGVFLLGGVSALAWLARPDHWYVTSVRFEGMHEADAAALRHLADVPRGQRVWEVDAEAVEAGVARHPWVRSAHAEVHWPDSVVVRIEERVPTAVLARDGGLLYVDDLGVPFLEVADGHADYPLISGLDADLVDRHPDLPGLVVRTALELADILDTRGLVPRPALSEIHFSSSRGFTVTAGRARLVFGLDGLDRQAARLSELVAEGVVDLQRPLHVDLAPGSVAIVRALDPPGDG